MSTLQNKHVVVLKGGPGSERKVSLASAQGVSQALRSLGTRITEVDVTGTDFDLPSDVDVVFNVIHGTFGEDGRVQSLLDSRGVAYTGEGAAGSALAFDKIKCKRRFVERGVRTPEFQVIPAGAKPTMPVPLVVKAPCEGSSVGVYIVKEQGELNAALEGAAQFAEELLIEEYIPGRELTVGIVGDMTLPVIEIRPRQGFYDFDNKYPFLNPAAAGADHLCPAPLDDELTRKVQEMALAAHRALDLEVYSRVDFVLSEKGEPYVLEINTIPGMTTASLLPEAAGVAGISYAELCHRIINLSLNRPKKT